MSLDTILDHIDGDLENSIARLMDLLRIESISTDPKYSDECISAAQWLVDDLNSIGFDAEIKRNSRSPNGHTQKVVRRWYSYVISMAIMTYNLLIQSNYGINHPFEPKLEETKNGPCNSWTWSIR